MHTEMDKKLILKFLEVNYPVRRIKHDKRFKRAIILDDGKIFFLSEKNTYIKLNFELVEILNQVFCLDKTICKNILNNFLPIKEY